MDCRFLAILLAAPFLFSPSVFSLEGKHHQSVFSGGYVGIQGGHQRNPFIYEETSYSQLQPDLKRHHKEKVGLKGSFWGGVLGYGWCRHFWYCGAEIEGNKGKRSGEKVFNVGNVKVPISFKENTWSTAFLGRVGALINPSLLCYIKGGWRLRGFRRFGKIQTREQAVDRNKKLRQNLWIMGLGMDYAYPPFVFGVTSDVSLKSKASKFQDVNHTIVSDLSFKPKRPMRFAARMLYQFPK